ncbi:MAG TPA: hypothetical protein VGC63_12715 [Solirubrobacterales bacterium]|jgi:hypothetical protein
MPPRFSRARVKLAVARELGDQPFNRERGAIYLNEALIDRNLPILRPDVSEDGIGDQRPASAAASPVQGVGNLVPPGQGGKFVTALTRRLQEADPHLVDTEGVSGQWPGRLLRA